MRLRVTGASGFLGINLVLKYLLDSRHVFRTAADPAPTVEPRSTATLDPLAVAVFLGALGLYWLTSARTPGWVDATLILNGARALELGTGVTTHNLFNLIGHLWLLATPFLDPHRSLVLLCVLLGSLTVLLLYETAKVVTGSRRAAVITAVAVGVSHSLWWHSTTIEVYTLNTVLIAAILLLVFRYAELGGSHRLYAAFFAFGLGVSNHVLMGLYLPAFAVLVVMLLVRRRIGLGEVALMVLAAAGGGSLYIFVFVRAVVEAGGLGSVLRDAVGGRFLSMMFPSGMSAGQRLFWLGNYLLLLLWNFPSIAIIFTARGFPSLLRGGGPRQAATVFFLTGLIVQVVWSANYLIWDMYAFSLPVYVMLAVPMAVAADAFLQRRWSAGNPHRAGRWAVLATLALPLVLYPSLSHLPRRIVDSYIALYPESRSVGGYWDPAEYVFDPIKLDYREADRFAQGWAARIPEGAHYWDDESKTLYPLRFYYQRERGLRTDVTMHTIFSVMMQEPTALLHARDIQYHLDHGDPVFVSSLGEPEREILNQLYHLEAPDTPLSTIRSLTTRQLVISFPRTHISEYPLGVSGMPSPYRLERSPAARTSRPTSLAALTHES